MPEFTRRLVRAALSAALLCAAAAAQEPTPTPTPEAVEDASTEIKSFERLEWR